MKCLVTFIFSFLISFLVLSKDDQPILNDKHTLLSSDQNLKLIKGKYYFKQKLYTGKLKILYKSGRIKAEISLAKGMLNGLSVGFLDNNRTDNYKKSYVYNYKDNRKVGDQFEYYDKSIQLPNYKKTTKNGYLEYAQPINLEPYFGNRDKFNPISWKSNEYCDRTFQRKNPDKDFLCPSGSLIVYYERFDLEYNNLIGKRKDNQVPSVIFFQSNYGITHSFWHLFRTKDGRWQFD